MNDDMERPDGETQVPDAHRQAVREHRAWRQQRLHRRRRRRMIAVFTALSLLAVGVFGWVWWGSHDKAVDLDKIVLPDWVDQAFIDLDGDARDGTPLSQVRDIVIHYVGNPSTSAMANRNYFNQPGVEVSSHFVVGLEGEIVQCLPLWEKSAASNHRNGDTISIEVCHPDETGKFGDKTYDSLIRLAAWLCRQLGLNEKNLIRHYDVTGKLCPLYYVEHEDAWEQLKADVKARMQEDNTTLSGQESH